MIGYLFTFAPTSSGVESHAERPFYIAYPRSKKRDSLGRLEHSAIVWKKTALTPRAAAETWRGRGVDVAATFAVAAAKLRIHCDIARSRPQRWAIVFLNIFLHSADTMH